MMVMISKTLQKVKKSEKSGPWAPSGKKVKKAVPGTLQKVKKSEKKWKKVKKAVPSGIIIISATEKGSIDR